jgi:hypothetical protein
MMMHDHGTRDLDEPRELTKGERDLLVALVEAARMDCREDLRCQVLTAKASAECRLSCGSIVLSIDRERCGRAASSGLSSLARPAARSGAEVVTFDAVLGIEDRLGRPEAVTMLILVVEQDLLRQCGPPDRSHVLHET